MSFHEKVSQAAVRLDDRADWTADEWAKDLMRDHAGMTLVSATITRGARRDLVDVKYRDENGKPARITVRLKHGKVLAAS